jgi:hypothetical protein
MEFAVKKNFTQFIIVFISITLTSILQSYKVFFSSIKNNYTFVPGEMAEWSNAAVLKTVGCNSSGGSNPSLSASKIERMEQFFQSFVF